MHLGKFPGSVEFESWKVDISRKKCARTPNPQITVHWIKEVEIAKSIDELMTSRSIVGRTDFHDFDMLDATIACFFKTLLNTHIQLPKVSKSSVLRSPTDSNEEDKLRTWIYEYFRATRVCEAVQRPSDLFTTSLENDDVQDFDVRWDQALSVSEMPSDVILQGLYKSKSQNSVQLQTVLALYDQENCSKQW